MGGQAVARGACRASPPSAAAAAPAAATTWRPAPCPPPPAAPDEAHPARPRARHLPEAAGAAAAAAAVARQRMPQRQHAFTRAGMRAAEAAAAEAAAEEAAAAAVQQQRQAREPRWKWQQRRQGHWQSSAGTAATGADKPGVEGAAAAAAAVAARHAAGARRWRSSSDEKQRRALGAGAVAATFGSPRRRPRPRKAAQLGASAAPCVRAPAPTVPWPPAAPPTPLQEEERERRMDFVPEESAINVDNIEVRAAGGGGRGRRCLRPARAPSTRCVCVCDQGPAGLLGVQARGARTAGSGSVWLAARVAATGAVQRTRARGADAAALAAAACVKPASWRNGTLPRRGRHPQAAVVSPCGATLCSHARAAAARAVPAPARWTATPWRCSRASTWAACPA